MVSDEELREKCEAVVEACRLVFDLTPLATLWDKPQPKDAEVVRCALGKAVEAQSEYVLALLERQCREGCERRISEHFAAKSKEREDL